MSRQTLGDRSKLRYPGDLTDDEWANVEPLIPPAKRGGNKRHVEVREVMNGIMYILSTGCQWRATPKDLKTVAVLRKTRHRGTARVGFMFTLAAAAYNLVRFPKLLEAPA